MIDTTLRIYWKIFDATIDREIHSSAVVAQSMGAIDAIHANRSIGQQARHSFAAWKKETGRADV
jgi:hypothetical protein